jgi:hypothetical protein
MKTTPDTLKRLRIVLLLAGVLAAPGLLQAQPTAHYVPGVEGIKGSSLPPPGLYGRDYNYFYSSDRLNNGAGNSAGPPNFSAFTYANVPRVIWITDTQVLGGFLGVDALLPLVYQSVEAGPYNSSTFGIGDLFAEGTLSWHPKQFDLAIASGVYAPTGDSGPPPTTRAGLGYWTFMQTAGATWYIDEEKTWAVSALNRYEFNTEQEDTHDTTGQAYTLEWGVSKTVQKVIDLGAVGYYQLKTTGDSGSNPAGLKPIDRAAAVGPEISVVIPEQMLFVSCRYLYEFATENRAQGSVVTVTLTKRF